jgi:hypothetical protein
MSKSAPYRFTSQTLQGRRVYQLRILGSALLLLLSVSSAAMAGVNELVGVPGKCDGSFMVSNVPTQCPPKGMLYSRVDNPNSGGAVLLSVPLPGDGLLSFVGEKDSQPKPEEY